MPYGGPSRPRLAFVGIQFIFSCEQEIPAIPITLAAPAGSEDCFEIRATPDVAKLAKHFTRGINRFAIEAGELSTEVLLDIEL